MRSYRSLGTMGLVLALTMTTALVGCRRAPETSSSTPGSTFSATWSGIPGSTLSDFGPMPGSTAPEPGASGRALPAPGEDLVEIDLDLPLAVFRGTPQPTNEPNVEATRTAPRPALLAPAGTINLALGRPVTCSDLAPVTGEVDLVTNGDKNASDTTYFGMRPGTQWVQVDLGQESTIYAVLLWHRHTEARVYRDVVVQVSDDPDFIDAVTVFNNDHDNSSGLGIGDDKGYVETSEGKLIDCGGVEGRYVRLYSRGNHLDGGNDYTEVEVYGKPSA